MALDSDCCAQETQGGVFGQESTNEASASNGARNEAIRSKSQMAFVFVPPGLCGYWYFAGDACGVQSKRPETSGWSGPLCAKCDELRSWLQQYLARDSDV